MGKFLSKTFQILQISNVMYKIFRVKMLPTVKYDGAPKHDKTCSKPHSQSMGQLTDSGVWTEYVSLHDAES